MSKILQEIAAVDWASLNHAYGSAADVPALLIARASQDRKAVKAADYEFFGNIHHQGTIYSATPPAARFLTQLFVDPGTLDRSSLAVLLGALVRGNARPREDDDLRHRTIQEVAAYVDQVWQVLDADVRLLRTVPYLLAGLPAAHVDMCARFPPLIAAEDDIETAASLGAALADVAGRAEAARVPLLNLLRHPIHVVRGLAAVGALRSGKAHRGFAADDLAEILVDALRARDEIEDFLDWAWGSLDEMLLEALVFSDAGVARAVVEALIPSLPTLDSYTSSAIAHTSLPLFFDQYALERVPDLTAPERALLKQLVRDTKVSYGDPCTQAILAAFRSESVAGLKSALARNRGAG